MPLCPPQGYPRYCTATTLADGSTVLSGGLSRRGKHRGPPASKELQRALKGCDDPLFLDFIAKCLEWDPEKRMTPATALRHAWLRRRLPRPPADPFAANGATPTSGSGGNGGADASPASSRTSSGAKAKLRVQLSEGEQTQRSTKLPQIGGVS